MYWIPVLLILLLLGSHLYLRSRRRPLRLRQEVPVVDLRPRGMARRTTGRSWAATAPASTTRATQAFLPPDLLTTRRGPAGLGCGSVVSVAVSMRDVLTPALGASVPGLIYPRPDYGRSAPPVEPVR